MIERIVQVTEVHIAFERCNPPNLIVWATGQVTGSGWLSPQLMPRTYRRDPADGLWGYDLLAEPPKETGGQAPSSVSACHKWRQFNKPRIKGVIVYGNGRGSHECLFEQSTAQDRAEEDSFIVIVPTAQPGPQHQGCLIIRAHHLFPAIYSKVFGPATGKDCAEWVQAHCMATSESKA